MSMPSPWMLPSPSPWRVGVRIEPFEACSGFTRVAAGRIAQPPEAAFVARLQPGRSPSQTARQLPDSSTSIRVEPSSTRETRRQGAHGDSLLNPLLRRQTTPEHCRLRPYRDSKLNPSFLVARAMITRRGLEGRAPINLLSTQPVSPRLFHAASRGSRQARIALTSASRAGANSVTVRQTTSGSMSA